MSKGTEQYLPLSKEELAKAKLIQETVSTPDHPGTQVYLEGFKSRDIPKHGEKTKSLLTKDTGPESAEGFNKHPVDAKCVQCQGGAYEPEKFSNPVSKKDKTKVNNFRKTNKSMIKEKASTSEFDRLYEQVTAGEEINFDTEVDSGPKMGSGGTAEDQGPDIEVDETEDSATDSDDITVVLQDIVDKLQQLIDKQNGSEVDDATKGELEDLEVETDGAEDGGEEVAKEGIEAEEIGSPLVNQSKGQPDKVTGKSNEVKSSTGTKASKGKAEAGTGGKARDGKLEELHADEDLSKVNKSMEVKSSKIKAGGSLFQQ